MVHGEELRIHEVMPMRSREAKKCLISMLVGKYEGIAMLRDTKSFKKKGASKTRNMEEAV